MDFTFAIIYITEWRKTNYLLVSGGLNDVCRKVLCIALTLSKVIKKNHFDFLKDWFGIDF